MNTTVAWLVSGESDQGAQCPCGGFRLLLLIPDQQFNLPLGSATGLVAEFDGQPHGIVSRDSQIGDAARSPAAGRDPDRVRRRAGGEEADGHDDIDHIREHTLWLRGTRIGKALSTQHAVGNRMRDRHELATTWTWWQTTWGQKGRRRRGRGNECSAGGTRVPRAIALPATVAKGRERSASALAEGRHRWWGAATRRSAMDRHHHRWASRTGCRGVAGAPTGSLAREC